MAKRQYLIIRDPLYAELRNKAAFVGCKLFGIRAENGGFVGMLDVPDGPGQLARIEKKLARYANTPAPIERRCGGRLYRRGLRRQPRADVTPQRV
jgi:hypothetical protein